MSRMKHCSTTNHKHMGMSGNMKIRVFMIFEAVKASFNVSPFERQRLFMMSGIYHVDE